MVAISSRFAQRELQKRSYDATLKAMVQIKELPTAGALGGPILVYTEIPLASFTSKDDEKFIIVAGLDEAHVQELKEKSLDESDEEIQKNTSDRQRFGLGSYEEWYGKGRVPFALVHEGTRTLAALAWFGPKQLGRKSLKHLSAEERAQDERTLESGDWHTIVYRSYAPFRGKGLMKAFTQFTMDSYKKIHPKAKLWAGVHAENPASLGLAQALGFVIDEERSDRAHHHYVLTLE
jgi:RimJ/RimL family protein N-acetyltransferase